MVPGAIKALMKETITVRTQQAGGEDSYAVRTFDSTTVKCYLDYRNRIVRVPGQEDIVSETQAYLAEDVPALKATDEVTLPSGVTVKVKAVRRPAWPDGTRHVEVFL